MHGTKKLIISITVIILFGVIASSFLSYQNIKQELLDITKQDINNAALSAKAEIEKTFQGLIEILLIVREVPELKSILTDSHEANMTSQSIKQNLSTYFSIIAPKIFSVTDIFVLDKHGNLIASTGTDKGISSDYSDRVYFQEGMQGKTSMSGPLISRTTGKKVCTLAVPIIVDNRAEAVLVATIELDILSKTIITGLPAGESANLVVTDREGNIIFTNLPFEKKIDIIQATPIILYTGSEQFTVRYQNENILTAYHKINGIDWYAFGTMKENSVFEKAYAVQRKSILINSIMLTLLTLSVALLLQRASIHDEKMNNFLQSEQAFLQKLLDESPSLMFIAQRDGDILLCNSTMSNTLGVFIGDSFLSSFADEDGKTNIFSKILEGHALREENIVLIDKKKIRYHVLASLIPIKYHSEPAILGWGKDVTEIINAKQVAIDALKTKSNFIAKISHEIRTPMNGVLGMIHLCLQTNPTPTQLNYLTKAQHSAKSLLSILNDILDFSKIEAGKLNIDNIPFHYNELYDNLFTLFSFQAQSKQLKLIFIIPPHIPYTLMGDPLRITQILSNLLSNAIKFTSVGSVTLEITVLSHSEETVYLRTTITDTGIGMTQEQCQKVFENFTQADDSITRSYGGTGLGLTICQQLAHLMGTEVYVTSTFNIGSTFTIDFIHSIAKDINFENTSHLSEGELESKLKAEKPAVPIQVLLVEDDEINQEIAIALLENLNCVVAIANNGYEAVQAVQDHIFDIIFMDIQMPKMGGLEATRTIRSLEGNLAQTTPIIAMTAHAMKEDIDKSIDAGLDDHIIKPIDPILLRNTLNRWAKIIKKNEKV